MTFKNRTAAQRGVSLIELMVALLLGLFLIFGAVTIYQQSRSTLRTTEAVARLQEAARLAFDVLESDVRMASYWGLSNRSDFIVNRAAPGQGLPEPFVATDHGTAINACGGSNSNWLINLDEYIGGFNDSYGLASGCPSFENSASGLSDTLIVRRGAAAQPATLDVNKAYIQTSRIQGTLFVPTAGCLSPTDPACIPPAYSPPASQTRELIVHAYYVADQSTLRSDVPSLRRKRLANINGATTAAAMLDEEIVPGVEDMQICFGIDTNGDTNVDAYANPGAVPPAAEILSATIWLRLRSEEQDFSHTDDASYVPTPTDDATALVQCGGADTMTAFSPADNYRRIVVSKTIQLRNTRT